VKYIQVANVALAGCLLLPVVASSATESKESNFSALEVSDDSQQSEESGVGSAEETFTQAGAHSSRKVNTNLQSVDSLLRSVPGTYTQQDLTQGTVNVNIRGMSGFGRVNTMVDGVSQSFYGTTPSSYHGGNNSSSGVLIDPNFLASIDIERGYSSGPQGVNALAGSANMRTIGVDDLLKKNRQTGVLSRFSVGDNGFGRSGMIAVAGRTAALGDGGSIGGLVGLSGNVQHATFENGAGVSSREFLGDDTQYMKQKPKSQLYKLNINPDRFNKIEFSGRNYENKFTRRDITSDDYYLKYDYTPLSELIDINMLASTSKSRQAYEANSLSDANHAVTTNRSNAITLTNTSRFSLSDYDFSWQLGGKLMDTRYERLFDNSDEKTHNTFAPAGKQKVTSVFTGLTINKDIYQLDLNLNYSDFRVRGFKPACLDGQRCFPQGASNIELNEHALNPSIEFSAQITPWLQPFASYSYSSRAPVPQEVFFANEGGASMNPFLKPEKAKTAQVGFNITQDGMLLEQDTFRLKALAYQTRIKNYIASERFFLCYDGALCQDIDNSRPDFQANIFTNSQSEVRTDGYEIEAGYDAEFAYLNISWSKQNTNQPTSVASTTMFGFGYDDLSDLPKSYTTVDVGARFFDKKLTVGSLIKFTGKSKRLSTEGVSMDSGLLEKEAMPDIPTVIDLYSNYQVTDSVLLRFSIQNLSNKNYANALNKMNQDYNYAGDDGRSINTTARGRTYLFGGEIRF